MPAEPMITRLDPLFLEWFKDYTKMLCVSHAPLLQRGIPIIAVMHPISDKDFDAARQVCLRFVRPNRKSRYHLRRLCITVRSWG